VNTGTGTFLEAAWLTGLASTDWTWSVRFCDLDEDGRVDFHATNGIPIFEDNPDTVNEFKRLSRLGRKPEALELARTMHRVDERNIARRNVGDLQFTDVGSEWGLDELGVSHGASFCDLDRDGDLDLIVNNLNRDASIHENRTHATHRVLVELRGRGGNRFGIGCRLTLEAGSLLQTRLLSPTRGYMSADEPVEHFGLGDSPRIDRLTVRWPSGAVQEFTELPADRRYTIHEPAAPAPPRATETAPAALFAKGPAIPTRHLERDYDDYAVQPLLPHRLSRLGPGLACGDADGDGKDDLWVGGAAGQAGTLLLQRRDGSFEPRPGPWNGDAEAEDMGALFLDHDGDGDLDLYVVSGGVEATAPELLQDRLYRNDGNGTFVRAEAGVLPDLRRSGSCACAADFDRDGDVDLFVGSRVTPGRFPEAPASALLRNDGGRFVDVTEELAPALLTAGMVTSAVWTDRDGDGFVDLVVGSQWQPLRLLHNDGGAALRDVTAEAGLDADRGQWNGVAAADLDGDGDMDLVATNLGLNTKYKADGQKPQRLYAADFDGNAQFDVVEAKHAEGKLLPVRGLSCSSEAMPFLLQRFPTYDKFARATLNEIYGAPALQEAMTLSCDELRHVVFEQHDGRFTARPLPRRAQIAPGHGIGVADFDGDGRLDLALAQNSFSPEPETGRADGGLGAVLRGGPGLEFRTLPPLESGIAVRGDQKGLCVLDLDGDAAPDFVLATNDGPLHAFTSRRKGGELAVRLRGPAGNPTGIGARIELVGKDGSRQVRELAAGAGYLSQAAPCAFFAGVSPGATLRVRWPDGTTTEHAPQAGGGTQLVVR
jgi:hypothetical protein